MPFPKECEPSKIQGDKLHSAVARVVSDGTGRADRPREHAACDDEADKIERERGAPAAEDATG